MPPHSTADPLPSSGQAGPCGLNARQGWSPENPQHTGVHPRPGAGELGGDPGGLRHRGWGLTVSPACRRGPWSAPPCSPAGGGVLRPPSPRSSRETPTRWVTACRGGGMRWVPGVGMGDCEQPRCPRGFCACVLPLWLERKGGPGLKYQGRGWLRGPWDPAQGAGHPFGGHLGVRTCFFGLLGDAVPFQVHVKLRPHVQQFLQSLSKTYEVPGAPTFPRGLQGAGGVPLGGGGDGGRTWAACAGTFACSPRSSSSQP